MKANQTFVATAIAALAVVTIPAMAQEAAPSVTIHGHANNPIGQPIKNDTVKFTKDLTGELKDRKFLYTFTTDANGDYKGQVAPGTYFVDLTEGEKNVDFAENVQIKAGEDKTLNFDLSRKDYMDKLSPEEKATIEEYRKKNAAAMAANGNIANLNNILKSTRADLASASPNYDNDVKQLQDATTANPNESLLYLNLGSAQVAKADHMAADDRTAHKPVQSDADAVAAYQSGIDSYKKGIELNAASKKPTPADQAIAWNSVGTAEAKIGKTSDAQAAFENAVKLNQPSAGMYYGNEAAVLFNAGSTDAAGQAADKAIAADPNRPDPYFIKGQSLIGKSTVDKAGKIQPPLGCVEAYQKYLELAPDGKMAPEVKNILQGMGQTINTKYKAGHK